MRRRRALAEFSDNKVVAVPGVAEQVVKTTFTGVLTELMPGDFFAFMLWRVADADTYANRAQVLTLEFDGYFWE